MLLWWLEKIGILTGTVRYSGWLCTGIFIPAFIDKIFQNPRGGCWAVSNLWPIQHMIHRQRAVSSSCTQQQLVACTRAAAAAVSTASTAAATTAATRPSRRAACIRVRRGSSTPLWVSLWLKVFADPCSNTVIWLRVRIVGFYRYINLQNLTSDLSRICAGIGTGMCRAGRYRYW